MSTWSQRLVRCPCGATLSAQLADGLHITRMPAVRAQILDGTFHNVTCPACKVTRVVQTKTIYTDFDRYHWVAVAPPWLVADWRAWSAVVGEEFERHMVVAAPPMVQALAPRFEVRLVFGLDALAEKLRAWDAGLDDRLVEALKLRVVRETFGEVAPGFRLRLIDVDRDRWRLTLSRTEPGKSGYESITMNLDAYLEVEATAAEYFAAAPELADPPFVSLDRYFSESLALAAEPRDQLLVMEPMRPDDPPPQISVPAPHRSEPMEGLS